MRTLPFRWDYQHLRGEPRLSTTRQDNGGLLMKDWRDTNLLMLINHQHLRLVLNICSLGNHNSSRVGYLQRGYCLFDRSKNWASIGVTAVSPSCSSQNNIIIWLWSTVVYECLILYCSPILVASNYGSFVISFPNRRDDLPLYSLRTVACGYSDCFTQD